MDVLTVIVIGLLCIAGASALGSRIGVAAPLLLVVTGIAVSWLPFVPEIKIEPEWILAGVLPPLLYSAAVSMPAIAFRRDFGTISALSVVLVVLSSVLLGLFFAWAIPDLGLAWGIALGAIMSPTDAVATSIVKGIGVRERVVAVLEGEGLLNDASALVILRAAIAGAAASVSLWEVGARFLYVIAVAVVIGAVVGHLVLFVRARLTDPAVNTAVSFTVPFLAAIPSEHLGASGLVAAVMAGLVAGRHAPEYLTPRHRLSDTQNWRTVELILEGGVFLVMGLQLSTIVDDVQSEHAGLGQAIWVAVAALTLTVLIRGAYVAPLLALLSAQTRRGSSMKGWLVAVQDRFEPGHEPASITVGPYDDETRNERAQRRWLEQVERRSRSDPEGSRRMTDRIRTRVRRQLADIEYLLSEPLGWREGGVIVWAGMRGAVTLAAAQTLPDDAPQRPLLILIAFLVATGSLLLQGGTLSWLVRQIRPARPDPEAETEESERLLGLLRDTAAGVLASHGVEMPARMDSPPATANGETATVAKRSRISGQVAVETIEAQRRVVLDAREVGTFGPGVLDAALTRLDADQISIELRGSVAD